MNDSEIKIEVMNSMDQATSYFDDKLYERVKSDDTKSLADLFKLGLHLVAQRGGDSIGIVSFLSFGNCIVIHPRIKECHMIYAERVCRASIDFINRLKEDIIIIAIIPTIYKANMKMAERVGLTLTGSIPKSFKKNNIKYDQLIYSMGD